MNGGGGLWWRGWMRTRGGGGWVGAVLEWFK